MTQPIPVVPVAPPPRPNAAAGVPAASYAAPSPAVAAPASVAAAVPYVHRFGSVPVYLLARFIAFAVDILVVAFVLATFGFNVADVGLFGAVGHDANGYATLVGISLGIALLIAFLCESIFGTTLGKLLFALHVRRGNGRHAGATRVFVRYLLRPLDLLVVGPLLALVTPRHQRIGDFLGGTVVGRSRIGTFASLLGLVLLVLIGYAQITLGGGITSALGVFAETADFAPGLVAQATRSFRVPAIAPVKNVAPQTQPTENTATPAPIPSGVVQ